MSSSGEIGSGLPVPEPAPNPETEYFWQEAAEERLVLPVCDTCGAAIWYPRSFCPFCHSVDVTWRRAAGTGTIYSLTTVRRGTGPYAAATPYVLAYVELTEGPRVLTNVVGADPHSLRIGQAVSVVFDRTESGRALPRFRPR